MELDCFVCETTISADDLTGLGETFLVHVRAEHDLPYPDQAVRNYAEATQRLTGATERVERIADLAVFPVTEDRIDDWLSFMDHDAFVGKPEWAACYCREPHEYDPADPPQGDPPHWADARATMAERLRSGRTYGYLGYVDGTPAAWVNASTRNEYALYRNGPDAEPADEAVVGVACFVIAPPYRRHGIAAALLDRVIADAGARGAGWIEAYPFRDDVEGAGPASDFRGPRSLYDARGFEQVAERERDVVLRRRVA